MKKLIIIAMVAVFALSLMTGIVMARPIPPGTFCGFGGDCNYAKEVVWTCCQFYKGSGESVVKCFWSDEYFEQWCE